MEKLYNKLISSYSAAFPEKNGQIVQRDVAAIWKCIKSEKGQTNVENAVRKKVEEWNRISIAKKGKLLSFWGKATQKPSSSNAGTSLSIAGPSSSTASYSSITVCSPTSTGPSSATDGHEEQKGKGKDAMALSQQKEKSKGPVQASLKENIQSLEAEINKLYRKRNVALITLEEKSTLKKKETELGLLQKKLKSKQLDQERQQKYRLEKKRREEEIFQEHPELKIKMKRKDSPGRPTLEDQQPLLLSTIIDLASAGCAADERRRSEKIRTIRTLDDLTKELKKQGFHLSRSGLYLRLIPRNALTSEGKRHVTTVPVKLIRSQNDAHVQHVDTKFCRATINNLEAVASILGPNEVAFLSQDDKARVQIGFTAANKQAPMLMHIQYKVKLADHDWVVAPKHKLVPSVIAGIVIEPGNFEDAVTYSGPTFVAIRSGKHSSSTAFTHSIDLNSLYEIPSFDRILKCSDGSEKPILIVTVDGGPDENPRYQKSIICAIDHFINHNLDPLFIATNAPGRSAFNRVERRMAPLSHDLAGLVLPHDHYGSHLNNQGVTIDEDLERVNFAHASKVLAEVWSSTVIDGFPVEAKYIHPSENDAVPPPNSRDSEWKTRHLRESQYMTQVVKCNDPACCKKPRSSYFNVMKDRFLPPPLPLVQMPEGLKVDIDATAKTKYPSVFTTWALSDDILPQSASNFPQGLPYDFACPSMQNQLTQRVCKSCGIYHATLTSLRQHVSKCGVAPAQQTVPKLRPQRLAAKRQRELMCVIRNMWEVKDEVLEWHDEEDVDSAGMDMPHEVIDSTAIPIVNINDILVNPWSLASVK